MANVTFFFVMFFSISLRATAYFTKCSNDSPLIQYPFYTKGDQQSVDLKNGLVFEILCVNNTTMIYFPSYGHLIVKSISYDAKKLDLIDPKICVHEVFLNLDLSLTPFRYYYLVKNYTYLNCSTMLSPSFVQIPCLSSRKHYVYTVEAFMEVPSSCKVIKTVAIPFMYSPYLADNSFGLGLTWDSFGDQLGCDGNCDLLTEIIGGFKIGLLQGLGIGIVIFAVAVALMTIKKFYFSMESVGQKELGSDKMEAEKYLGEYKIVHADQASVDKVGNRC